MRSNSPGYNGTVGKDRLLLAVMLVMLVAAVSIATAIILGAVEDCGPDGDCNL